MAETTDALVLDLVEWIAREPRPYSEVIETWRTSCPRLTIWEDAVDRGFVTRQPSAAKACGSRSPRAAKNSCATTAAAPDGTHHIRAPGAAAIDSRMRSAPNSCIRIFLAIHTNSSHSRIAP